MKIELKKFGEFLISRPDGREAFLIIKSTMLSELKPKEEIVIDFSGVNSLAPSWADEVVTPLFEEFKNVKLINTGNNSSIAGTLKILKEYSDVPL